MRLCHVRPLPTGCLKHCEGVGLGQPRAPHPPERPLLVGSCPLLPMQARDRAMFRLKQKTKNHTRRDSNLAVSGNSSSFRCQLAQVRRGESPPPGRLWCRVPVFGHVRCGLSEVLRAAGRSAPVSCFDV